MRKQFFLTMACWCMPLLFWGQQEINFTALTTKNGLSSNTVNAILKDRYGLMWFATEDGLDKFDGTSFTIYRNKQDDPKSLRSNEITALHEDNEGHLWIGTGGGSLSLYNREDDSFIHYPVGDTGNVISNNVIRSICSDYRGRIWIANFNGVNVLDPRTKKISRLYTNEGRPFSTVCLTIFEDKQHHLWIGTPEGLYEYNPANGAFTEYLNHPGNPSSLIGNTIAAVVQDKKGNIWIGTQQGLSRMKSDGKTFINYSHSDSDPQSLSSNIIRGMAFDANGKLWIGTERGLNILDTESGKITRHMYDFRNVHGLTGEGIRSVYIDNTGIYWLGTIRGGIVKYDKNLNLFNLIISNPFDKYGLNAPVVTSFAEQADGKVFVGTEGGGLSLFDPQTKQFRHYELTSARKGADKRLIITSLQFTSNNRLLVGTLLEGLFIVNPANGSYRQILNEPGPGEQYTNEIYCIKVDRSGNWWLGTNGNGVCVMNSLGKIIRRYTPKPMTATDVKLPINGFIRDILEDRTGTVWIATHGGGMTRLNTTSGRFEIFNTMNSRLPNDKVQSLLEDRRGNIWAGTFGGGLCRIDQNSGTLSAITEKDGLQNNTIYKIIEDDAGLLWLSTNKGLSRLDPVTKKINNYNYYNGIQRNNFFHGAGLLCKNGILYFGGLEGFNYFNPKSLKKNTNIPIVLITDLKISNQSVTPSPNGVIKKNISIASEINLAYKQNFALNYVGVSYTAPGQNQYAYKLDGFDKEWNYVGSTTIAHYTNLDPGEYVFRVKASNNDGFWSGDSSIKIIVQPPLWRTTSAYIFYIVSLILLSWYLRYKSIERIKRKFRLEQQKKETERIHEIDQLKIKFLTNLSHEFRTPISLILGPVDKLLSHEERAWKQGHLHLIKRNAKRLLNLVNQLLDFRKMEEQELKLQTTDGELISFVKDIFDSFKDLSERKKILFTFSSTIDHFNTCFDHDKIERILFNILSNAFKFTLEGGKIALFIDKIGNIEEDPGKTWLLMKVFDTGIGIPKDQKNNIFDRFFQHPVAGAILNQGTGIGLSITKEFVMMQGGRIEVESEEGKGTSFNVYLPFSYRQGSIEINHAPEQSLQKNLPELPPAATDEKEMAGLDDADITGRPSVLLVEDDDDFRFYLKENLRVYYTVYEATNGKEGWEKALARHPQLIVSDISMPYMDGIELCAKLKSDKRTNHIPIILLTALTAERDQLKGLETGANDYITKPFTFEVLRSKIKNLLILKDTFKNTYTRKIDINTPIPEIKREDEKLLAELILYLEEHIADTNLSVTMLSRHLGMSRSSLYNKLFELTGQTPVEYIRSVRLEKAAALIEKSDMTIAQIAYSVGFATPKYFAKSFKAKYNVLPSEYMNKMRGFRDKKSNK